MKKRRFLGIIGALMGVIFVATVAVYFYYKPDKPWFAFFIACCGGVLIVNLIISMLFINKNFKDKR